MYLVCSNIYAKGRIWQWKKFYALLERERAPMWRSRRSSGRDLSSLSARRYAILLQGSRVNFLYMGSMFRFREKVRSADLSAKGLVMRKRSLLSAGCSGA